MSRPVAPRSGKSSSVRTASDARKVHGRRPEELDQQDDRITDADHTSNWMVADAGQNKQQDGRESAGMAPAEAGAAPGQAAEGAVDPNAVIANEPPAAGPLVAAGGLFGGAGATTAAAAAAATAVAAAAAGGGKGGDNNDATTSAKPATPNATLSDTGLSTSDGVTNTATIAAPSNTASGASVEYRVDGGAWARTYTPPTSEGSHTVEIRQVAANGQTSDVQTIQFTLDTQAPQAATVKLAGDDQILLAEQDAAAFVVTGLDANAIATVTFKDAAGHSVTAQVTGTGATNVNGSADLRSLSDGKVDISLVVSDAAGNTVNGTGQAVTLDSIKAPTVILSNDTGSSAGDGITKDASLNISAAPADIATRTISVDGKAAGPSYVAPTADGTHTVVVTDTDKAGNTASTSYSFTLDRTAPAGASVALVDDKLINRQEQLDLPYNISGLEAGTTAKVVFTDSLGTKVTRTITGTGASPQADKADLSTLADGAVKVTIDLTDVAGNTATGTGLTATLDGIATPTIGLVTDNGTSASDKLTNDASLNISATPGDIKTRVINVDGVDVGSSYTPVTADGTHTVKVTDTDQAGNVATGSFTFTLDKTAPTAPAIALSADSGAAGNDKITNKADLNLSAIAAGVTRVVTVDGATVGSSYTPVTTDGAHTVKVSDTDAAGNTSSSSLSFTLDTKAPTNLTLTAAGGDALVNKAEQAALGYTVAFADAEAASTTVALTFTDSKGNKVSSTPAGGAGTVDLSSLSEGLVTATYTATDLAGNVKTGTAATLTLDRTLTAPTIALSSDSGSSGTDSVTNKAALSISAAPADIQTRVVNVDGSNVGSSYTPVTSEGTHTVKVTDTDLAGNTASQTFSFVLDTQAPATLNLTAAGGDSNVNLAEQTALAYTVAFAATEADTTAIALTFTDVNNKSVTSIPVNKAGNVNLSGLAEGAITVSYTATDLAGNVKSGTAATLTLDRTLATPSIALVNDTGSSNTDGITKDASLVISAAPADLATRVITVDGKVVGSAYVAPTTDGAHTIVVTDTDKAGNTASKTFDFTLDKTAPGAASVALSGDKLINRVEQSAAAFTVSSLDNAAVATVTFTDSLGKAVSTKVTGTGAATVNGSIDLGALADGTITLSISVSDLAGNTVSGTGQTATLDGIATPTVVLLHDNGSSSTDKLTNDASLAVSAAPADIKTRVFTVDGKDSTTYVEPTTDGVHTIKVTDTDQSGNVASSTVLSFTLDKTAPAAPTLKLVNDTGSSDTDGRTSVGTLNATTTETNGQIAYSTDGGTTWTGTATLKEGSNTVLAHVTDAAGNVSANASLAVTLDTIAPATLTLTPAGSDTYVNKAEQGALAYTVAFATAEADSTTIALTFTDSAGNKVTSTPVNKAGTVNLSTLTEGAITVSYTATDLAGNVKSGTAATLTLDRTLAAPTIKLGTDSGTPGDAISNNPALDISAAPADIKTRVVTVDGSNVGSSYTPVTAEGKHSVTVTDTDQAGNTASSSFDFTFDKTPPAAPSLKLDSDTGAKGDDGITKVGGVTATSAEAGARVEYSLDGGKSWFANATLKEGSNTVLAHAIDVAGNISGNSTLAATLDTIVPATLSFTPTGDNYVNKAEQGGFAYNLAFASAEDNGTVIALTFTDSAGQKIQVTPKVGANTVDLSGLAEGSISVSYTATDLAGNVTNGTAPALTLDRTLATPGITLSTDSGTAGDGLTNNAGLTLSSQPQDIKTRVVTVDGVAVGNTYVAPSADGNHTVTVTDTDLAGNTATNSLSFKLDKTAPAAPTLVLNGDTGASANDRITQAGTVTATSGEADAKIEYSTNGGANWTTSVALVEGSNTILAHAIDAAGNTSGNASISVTLDTKAPSTLTLTPAGDSVVNQAEQAAQAYTVAFATAEPTTTTIKLTFGDSAGRYVTSTPLNGSGTVDLSTLAEGTINVNYTATDLAGNVSSGLAGMLTLDRSVSAPLSVALKSDSGISNSDGKTNVADVVATGTEAGAKVEFSIDNGKTWSTAIAPAEGSVTVMARQTDAAGNVSASSAPFTFTYDKTAPTAPNLSLALDSGDSSTDRISRYGSVQSNGVEANARVEYSIDAGKTWTSSFTAQEGANSVQARAIDEAGNASAASNTLTFTLDTIKPDTPSLNLGDNLINRAEQPAFAFTLNGVEAKSTAYVTFLDSNKHTAYKTFTGTGAPINATIDLSEFSDGDIGVSVYVVDQAGNVSSTTTASAKLDGIATPTIGLLNDTWAGAGSNQDLITRDARITVSDKPADLKTREYTVDGVKQVGGYVAPTTDGQHTVTVTDTDLSGNVASATLSFTLDTQIDKPLASVFDTGSNNADGLTNTPWLKVSNLEAGSTIQYSYDNGGTWNAYFDPSTLPDGAYTAQVKVTDLAGNSAISDPVSYTLDRTISTPMLSLSSYLANSANYQNFTYQLNTTDSDITQKTVSFTDRTGRIVYDGDGAVNLSSLSDGQITVQGWVTDKAGNVSQTTPQYFTLQVFDIVDATINASKQLVLTFNRDLDTTVQPLADNFRVLINGESVGFTGLSIAGKNLTLQAGQNLIPEQIYSLSVTYGESNNAGASPDALRAADGTYRNYLNYQEGPMAFTPAIQRISTGPTPDLDIYVFKDTLEILVEFNTGVVITNGSGGSKPYITLDYLDASGQTTQLKAYFNPWGGSYDGNYPLQTARFTVDLSPAVLSKNGSWKVSGLELNGATIKDYSTKTLSLDTTSFGTAAQDFAAGGYYVPQPTLLDNGGVQGTSGNDIFVWDDITKMPAGVLTGNFSGVNLSGNTGGDRDFLGVHILVSDTALAPAVANQYTLRFDPATRLITIYNEAGAAIKTVTVPQGTGWPNGVEGIYYTLAFKDSSQGGAYAQVNDGDTGEFVLRDTLAYVDPQRTGDVFVQGSSYADTIDVSAAVKLTSNGASRTVNAGDRIAIRGGQGNDTITGHSGSDVIYGDEGSNVIHAGAGDDIIGVYADTAGSNIIDGGSGKDLVRISLLGDHIEGAFSADGNAFNVSSYQKNYSGGADTVYGTQYVLSADEASGQILLKTSTGGTSYTNTLVNVEGVQLRFDNKAELSDVSLQVGTNNGERLISKGDGGVIFGMGGDDVIKAIADGDLIFGGTGNDTLIFSGQREAEISGGGGRDTAVAITTAWGPLSAMAVSTGLPTGVTAAWKIVSQYDTTGISPFHLVQRLADGTYNIITYEAGMNVSNGASASTMPTQPVSTLNHLTGVEVLKFEAADGTLFGTFVLDNDLKPISPSMSLSSDGKQLTLTFGTTLDAAVAPPTSAFEIEAREGNVPVSGVAIFGNTVTLTLSQPLMGGITTVRYADATMGDDTAKVLQADGSGKDMPAFQVTSNLPTQAAHIIAITGNDMRGVGAMAEGDSTTFTLHFSAPVLVTAAADGSLPTLTLNLTAPDGSVTQVAATLQYSLSATSTPMDQLTFVASVDAGTIGTFSVAGVALHGAKIGGAYHAANPPAADLGLGQAFIVPSGAFYSHGSHVSADPLAAGAGTAANDLLVFGYEKAPIPNAIVQGDYSSVNAGAGNRDTVVVNVMISDVKDSGATGQYELRYAGSGATKYVELWKLGGTAALQQYAVPDAAHWPANTELLMFQPVFIDASGTQQFADCQWLTLSRTTLVYGSGSEYTVHGSMGDDTINVSSTLTPTDGTAHTVVNGDRIQILGGLGNDTITGHGGMDWIDGGAGSNVINAGGGDDVIVLARNSGNTIDGGAGNDTLLLQVAGGDSVDYGDANGALHLGSRFYSSNTGMIDGPDQFTLAYDEAKGKITIVDVAHGGQFTTVSNVENISLLFDSYPRPEGGVALKVGSSGADNVALTEQGALYFGGAGNDTIDATGAVWTTLFGGSGDDTFKFTANSDTTLLGGVGNDKGVMVFGSSLSPLQLEHVAGSLDWSVTDTPNHALLTFSYNTAHQGFEVKVAHSADYGFGTGGSYDSNTMSISSVETLVLQTARGDTMLSLKIDETNKTVSVLPV